MSAPLFSLGVQLPHHAKISSAGMMPSHADVGIIVVSSGGPSGGGRGCDNCLRGPGSLVLGGSLSGVLLLRLRLGGQDPRPRRRGDFRRDAWCTGESGAGVRGPAAPPPQPRALRRPPRLPRGRRGGGAAPPQPSQELCSGELGADHRLQKAAGECAASSRSI